MKKNARRRRKHCALAVVRRSQKFHPAADPFPGARDGQNLISWRWSLPLPTSPVWWGSMHAVSSSRGNKHTHTPTNKQTGPITIHCAAASTQCNQSCTITACVLYSTYWVFVHVGLYIFSFLDDKLCIHMFWESGISANNYNANAASPVCFFICDFRYAACENLDRHTKHW